MDDPLARPALLPRWTTPRERAIEAADAAVEARDTDLIRRVGGPDLAEVPAEYLPARAQARSVDVWDPLWPEAVRRAVIASAPAVHRLKGTVAGLKASLAALRVEAMVTEWWQETPRGAPYTFSVRAYVKGRLYDGPVLDARLVRVVHATIMRVKPESRAFDLALGVNLPAVGSLAPVLVGKAVVARAMVPRAVTDFSAGLGLAPVLVPKVRVARAMRLAFPAS